MMCQNINFGVNWLVSSLVIWHLIQKPWCITFACFNRTPNISHITHKVVQTLNQKYILWHNSVNIEARKMKLLPLESSWWDEHNGINFIKIESLVVKIIGYVG